MNKKEISCGRIGKVLEKCEDLYTTLILCGTIIIMGLMFYRAFFGTELSDEAYYVSEAKAMLNGNVPFAYNYSSKALGFAFILIFIEWIYGIFVPNLEGIFLFTRLCFVAYKIIAFGVVYKVFSRREKKYQALLLSSILLPLFGSIGNFNYNTIPIINLLIAGIVLYDTIEQDAPRKRLKISIAGFITGIACFANPGWAVALIVFVIILFVRLKDVQKRKEYLLFFLGGVFAEVLIVVVGISMRTSLSELFYGFYRIFINPIPMDSLNPGRTWEGVIGSFKGPIKRWIQISISVSLITYILSSGYIIRKEKKFEFKQRLILSVTAAMASFVFLYACVNRSSDMLPYWGFAFCIYVTVFWILGLYSDEKILWYLAIYPPMYTIASIILVSNQSGIARFSNCFTVIIPILFVLIKNELKLVRMIANVVAVILIVAIGYADFHYVYRDDSFHNLTAKVESGVYKGIYTTETRSKDLPELEEYLNSLIGEDETYAFRDNVPSAYLMVHRGKVCEISTWDILQYTYDRNSPAVLFDYYRVRDMIPDKIIYIDFGRDEKLSIEEKGFRYNDWVNSYYELVEEIELNETYYHIMVYQYNGTFDGNYQRWIDNYWELVK